LNFFFLNYVKGFQAKVHKVRDKTSDILYAAKIYNTHNAELIYKVFFFFFKNLNILKKDSK